MTTTPATGAPLPTFLLLGAMKAGTTSLFKYLAQHPDICFSRDKEPHYLAAGDTILPPDSTPVPYASICRDLASYRANFAHWRGQRAIGEASTSSLDSPEAPARAAALLPGARLLVILRQPADRAISHVHHNYRVGREPDLNLRRALKEAPARPPTIPRFVYGYRQRSCYLPSLQNWLAHYPRPRLAVLFNDDLDRDPVGTVRAACRHIGVDDSFTPDTSLRFNTSGVARNRVVDFAFHHARDLRRFLETHLPPHLVCALARKLRHPPKLDPQLRAELTASYREDILALGAFVDRDLSPWLDGRKLPPPPDGLLAR
jgi:hypothetical protein